MSDIGYIIQIVAASAMAGGVIGYVIGTLQQHKEDCEDFAYQKAANRKLRNANRQLRWKLAATDAQHKQKTTPDTNNDWLRETVQFPAKES